MGVCKILDFRKPIQSTSF